jgi:ornithine cyclodeaminase/alanine dehydrogenase-like protein (mu-crystallin family)
VTAAAGTEVLDHFDLIITATNSGSPVFGPDDIKSRLVLHLGGDETPAAHLERTIRHGLVLCDSVEMVSRRNSQSLALYFAQRGASLETLGPLLGIRTLATFEGPVPEGIPIHITCVGLPMLDLYVGAHVYEALLQNEGRPIPPAVQD